MGLIIPKGYRNLLGSVEATEKAIKCVKDMFQENLSAQLALLRVTAPMVVLSGTGINDDLNGVERPVSFPIKSMGERRAEVVHSLAKWKRMKLAEMQVPVGRGIYTDMNALRPDEDLDNLHSLYVDQWDWEKVIRREDRNREFLKKVVRRIYEAVKVTENDRVLNFLPYAHIFEKGWTILCISEGATLIVNTDPHEVQKSMKETHPTSMCAVPRFWEKVYTGVKEKIDSANPIQRKLFKHALAVGRKHNIEYLSRGKRPPLALHMEYEMYNKTLFSLVRHELGP